MGAFDRLKKKVELRKESGNKVSPELDQFIKEYGEEIKKVKRSIQNQPPHRNEMTIMLAEANSILERVRNPIPWPQMC